MYICFESIREMVIVGFAKTREMFAQTKLLMSRIFYGDYDSCVFP